MVIFSATPLIFAYFVARFNQITRLAMPIITGIAYVSRMNRRACTTPGFIRRTYFGRTVRVAAYRAFPAVYARCMGRIDAVTTFFTAPTVLVRTSIRLQMPDFATGIVFVDITIPRMIVRNGFGGIINGMTGFTEPVTLRAGFRK